MIQEGICNLRVEKPEDKFWREGTCVVGTESMARLAQLGFHDHPTKTPTRTAIQMGAINIPSSNITSPKVGLCKISSKAATKPIIKKEEEATPDSIVNINFEHGDESRVSKKRRRRRR